MDRIGGDARPVAAADRLLQIGSAHVKGLTAPDNASRRPLLGTLPVDGTRLSNPYRALSHRSLKPSRACPHPAATIQ
jgi:hypothetical protein